MYLDFIFQVEIAQNRVNRWAINDAQESNGSGTSLLANQE